MTTHPWEIRWDLERDTLYIVPAGAPPWAAIAYVFGHTPEERSRNADLLAAAPLLLAACRAVMEDQPGDISGRTFFALARAIAMAEGKPEEEEEKPIS